MKNILYPFASPKAVDVSCFFLVFRPVDMFNCHRFFLLQLYALKCKCFSKCLVVPLKHMWLCVVHCWP